MYCFTQGALAGQTKQRVFHIPCDMQHNSDLLCPDYTKEKTKENKGMVLVFGATMQQKENGVRSQGSGFL